MKISWRTELPQLALIALMFVVAAVCWNSVPGKIPVHWNFRGEVDRYGGRFEGLLGIPLMTLGLYLLLLFLPRLDPGYANYRRFATVYTITRYALVVFFAFLYFITLLAAYGHPVDVGAAVLLAVGLLFLVLGNFMGKVRPNWFVGIRTPWTLSSKLSWNKTHRLGGWLFIAMGLVMIVAALLHHPLVYLGMVVGVVGCVAGLVIYSYRVWRQDPARIPPSGTTPADD